MKANVFAAFLILFGSGATARDTNDQHAKGTLAIEHVDFIASEDEGVDNIYLTLWNGMPKDAVVTGVSVTGYEAITIVASPPAQSPVEMEVSGGALTIPGLSGVSMEQDSIYFRATRSASDIGVAVVTLSMSDGTQITRFVAGPQTNSIALAHQHGEE